jgi:phosphoglycolate phosphatase-like HAD superfamily hydrolase
MPRTRKRALASLRSLRDAADVVHRQLEYLKYIGSQNTQGMPSGQGTEITIVLLPDLLIDVHKDRFRNGTGTCVVGGRAARLACVLLHLLTDDDGTYRVHLLAKTSPSGRALLEEQLRNAKSRRAARLCFDTIYPRPGEPRCAVFDGPGVIADSADPRKEDELGPAELKTPAVERLLKGAASVYFSSIRTPYCAELLDVLARVVDRKRQNLFLDATRGERGGTEPLDTLCRLLEKPLLCDPAITALFVNDSVNAILLRRAKTRTPETFSKKYGIPVIRYGTEGIRFYKANDEAVLHIDRGPDFASDGVSERFKAGVLLASSLYRKISLLAESGDEPCRAFHEEWHAAGTPWKMILDYGMRLALVDCEGGFPDLRSVVQGCPDHLCKDSQHLRDERNMIKTHRNEQFGAEMLTLDTEMAKHVARLAGLRRNDALKGSALARCGEPICTECPLRTGQSHDYHAAVMIDLDGTLMDSTDQRNRGLVAALRELEDVTPWPPAFGMPENVGTNVEFFAKYVYEPWEFFKEWGFGDFRQAWNQDGWYAMYTVLVSQEEWFRKIADVARKRRLAVGNERPGWICQLKEDWNRAKHVYKTNIQRAQTAFSEVPFLAFKEARDFLDSLRQCGFRIYVVSEGDADAQWDKIRRTGLDDFFERCRVLTTADAASPKDERKALDYETKELRRARIRLLEERDECMARYLPIFRLTIRMGTLAGKAKDEVQNAFDEALQEYERIGSALYEVEMNLKVAEFVGLVLERMAAKSGRPFYAAVVRAILHDGNDPLSVLTSFRRLMQPLARKTRIKFAMIGDRAENDIRPPSDLLGREHLLTVRFISGKYHSETPGRNGSTLAVYTLAQAKVLLLQNHVWYKDPSARIQCVDNPPIFNWTVHLADKDHFPTDKTDAQIGLNWIDRGLAMPGREENVISRICAGILVEYLHQEPSSKYLKDVLSMYLDPPDELADTPNRLRKLCRLVVAGLFEHPAAVPYAADYARVIYEEMDKLKAHQNRAVDVLMGREALRTFAKCDNEAGKIANAALTEMERWGWVYSGLDAPYYEHPAK